MLPVLVLCLIRMNSQYFAQKCSLELYHIELLARVTLGGVTLPEEDMWGIIHVR